MNMITKFFSHIVFLILGIMILIAACKKKDDTAPAPVQMKCEIINPLNEAEIQVGAIVNVEAEVSGFGSGAKVVFTIDSLHVIEVGGSPYIFLWDTKDLLPDTIKIRAEAYEGAKLVSDTITVFLIDTIIPLQPPVPIILITPNTGTTDTVFIFDASESHDQEDMVEDLLFRWDFEGDGEWDTDFSHELTYEYKYSHTGHYHVRMEVMDTDTMQADTTVSLVVTHSITPDPCEGIVSIPYGGRIYHTAPVGNQCWLRENMDIGVMISEGEVQDDNQVIEKYCYDNDTANCEQYGGLYTWKEAMSHVPFQGGRGICPVGYHIPDDSEWKELEGYIDSQYEVGNPLWENEGWRGLDAGKRMKALLTWIPGGNGNNLFGFKVLAAGYWETGFSYTAMGEEAQFWGSSHDSGQNSIKRALKYDQDGVSRSYHWDEAAFSVRCIRD